MRNIGLLIGLILSFSAVCFSQKVERVIDFYPNQPNETFTVDANNKYVPTTVKGAVIISISVEGKAVKLGEPFTAGDDWLKTLTVKLKNVSDQPIASVSLSFSRPEAKFNASSLGFSLAFGSLSPILGKTATNKSIKPGEEFELSKTEEQYLAEKKFMTEKTGVTSITKVLIGAATIKFEDGSLWTTRKISLGK